MELYHIHRHNNQDEKYYEGATIEIGKENNSMWESFINRSCTYVYKIDKDEKGMNRYHHKTLKAIRSYKDFLKLSPEEQEIYFEYLNRYAINTSIDIREIILEDVRKELRPDAPSRKTCCWLTNKGNLDRWLKNLNLVNGYEVYQVSADGKLFSSTEELLPVDHYPHGIQSVQAIRYWNPKRSDFKDGTREILFEGELKLLKRVK